MRRFIFALTLLTLPLSAVDLKAIFPATKAKALGPYSPGVMANGFLYISGQGGMDAEGKLAADLPGQIKQAIDNIKAILHGADLRLENLLYVQVYLADMSGYDTIDQAFAAYFPTQPARTILGVNRLPGGSAVEISAVAFAGNHDSYRLGDHPMAVKCGDRVYFSGVLGKRGDTARVSGDAAKQADVAFTSLDTVLKDVELKLSDLSFVSVYHSATMSQADAERFADKHLKDVPHVVIETASIPLKANIEVTAIKAPDLVFTTAESGTTGVALNALKSELTSKGTGLGNVVAANVYIDSIDNLTLMNGAYAPFFAAIPPARTTVEATKSVAGKQTTISLVAVK